MKLQIRGNTPEIKFVLSLCYLGNFSGIHGEHSETEGGVYDISNKARLGIDEYTAVKQMYDGVKKLIEMEKEE